MATVLMLYGVQDRLAQAARLALKYHVKGWPLLVYSSDSSTLANFSQALWAVSPTAFVPHPFLEEDCPLPHQVRCSTTLPEQAPSDWTLLNLDSQCPPQVEGYARVLEVVSILEKDRLQARQRVHDYRNAGHDVQWHQVASD